MNSSLHAVKDSIVKRRPYGSWRRVVEILEDLEELFPSYLKINPVPIGIQCSTGSNKIWSNIHFKAVWHTGFQFCDVYDLKCFFFFLGPSGTNHIMETCWPQRTKCFTLFHKDIFWGTVAVTLVGSRRNYFQLSWVCEAGAALLQHLLCREYKMPVMYLRGCHRILKTKVYFSVLSSTKDILNNFNFHGKINNMPGNDTCQGQIPCFKK